MYVYNLTINVDNTIVKEWIQLQKQIHIPDVISTGLFYEHQFFKLLEQDETEGKTFYTIFGKDTSGI